MRSERGLSYWHHAGLMWAASLLVIGLAFAIDTCTTKPAHAGVYLDLAGGVTQFLVTTADGDYLQRGLPHDFDLRSMAYRVELGYRFNERWSVQGGYLNLGTVNQTAQFVADSDYNNKIHQCISNCGTAAPYHMTDKYKGVELTATRTFPFDQWAVFVKGGGAGLHHTFTVARYDGSQGHTNHAWFPAVVLGGGVSYKWAYLETSYYHGLGGSNGFMGHDQGWPLSKEMFVTWFGVKIPLS